LRNTEEENLSSTFIEIGVNVKNTVYLFAWVSQEGKHENKEEDDCGLT
jgi:hypothetical protein